MCGVVGIVSSSAVNLELYDALTVLQHRGQDAAGIVTIDETGCFRQRKANGLVRDVFEQKHMRRLQGNIGIGHVRYPTAGSSSAAEAQPFYVNSPYGIALAHNGNLTNANELKLKCEKAHRHVNTSSDSEILLNIFAWKLSLLNCDEVTHEEVFEAVRGVNEEIVGAYAVVALIIGGGLVAFRDPLGIRPLVLGQRAASDGRMEYAVASESVALSVNGFILVRDIAPGEAIFITPQGELYSAICAKEAKLQPCIFEYVYFARPDSIMNGVSVYAARVRMGTKLAKRIQRDFGHLDIDVVIPIPETSCDIAVEIARILKVPYRQGFVKNRYIGRTFIMPGQKMRKKSVRNKLNPIPAEFAGKKVLLVDDSIVRGTTSEQIVDMAHESGARAVYFASAAPEIRYPNVYGIDMPTAKELIASNKSAEEVGRLIHADALIYQTLEDLEAAVREENPSLTEFETSVFTGNYITPGIDEEYFAYLDKQRSDDAKADKAWNESNSDLELFNI